VTSVIISSSSMDFGKQNRLLIAELCSKQTENASCLMLTFCKCYSRDFEVHLAERECVLAAKHHMKRVSRKTSFFASVH
jgi:hypothetical protein